MGTLKINKKVKLEAVSFTVHKNPVSLFFFFFFFFPSMLARYHGQKWGHFKKWNTSVQESLKSLLKGGIQKGTKTAQKTHQF